MRIAGVIAEYNPFHDGHAYHLRQTKDAGADAVVAVMSGNYVQRGTPAILSKWARAAAAAQCGADLVLELPVPFAAARAQTFADGAVAVLHALGNVEMLSFGSECGDPEKIRTAAEALRDPAVCETMRAMLSDGAPFAAAREAAVRALYGDAADVLHSANDTLAAEYIRASRVIGAPFSFLAVPRIGAHDAPLSAQGFRSASAIRERLLRGEEITDCPSHMRALWDAEKQRSAAPARLEYMERAILQRLREASPEEIRALPDVSEGLENRILDAARHADSLETLCARVKTKRYSYARIRRIVLACFLDLRAADIPKSIPYLRVLAIGARGAEILRQAKQTCRVPILSRTVPSALDGAAKALWETEKRADERYALLLPEVQEAETQVRFSAFVNN